MIDNYGLWKAHDDAMEDRLSKCPLCANCSDPIQDEYGYRLDGELYCWDCALDWLRDTTAEYIDLDE